METSCVDPFLADLDYQCLNIYFPREYRSFAEEVMEAGVNQTHVVGIEIWTVADFTRVFDRDWQVDNY